MREIKFRVWDKKEKLMEELAYPWAVTDNEVWNLVDNEKWKSIDLMQFTGLKDKNGVEIYDGDILENHRDKKIKLFIVMWLVAETGFGLHYIRRSECHTTYFNQFYNLKEILELQVVGNIYENTELIEGKQQR